jgi:hypothetical protein
MKKILSFMKKKSRDFELMEQNNKPIGKWVWNFSHIRVEMGK